MKTDIPIRILQFIMIFACLICKNEAKAQKDYDITGIWRINKVEVADTVFADYTNPSNYELFKYIKKDGSFYTCIIYDRHTSNKRLVPTEFSNYTFKDGEYIENGRKTNFKPVNKNTFTMVWGRQHETWKRENKISKEEIAEIVEACENKYVPQMQEAKDIASGKLQVLTGVYRMQKAYDKDNNPGELASEMYKIANSKYSFHSVFSKMSEGKYSLYFIRHEPLTVTGENSAPVKDQARIYNATDNTFTLKWYCNRPKYLGLDGNDWLYEEWKKNDVSEAAAECFRILSGSVSVFNERNIMGAWESDEGDPSRHYYYILTKDYITQISTSARFTRQLDPYADIQGICIFTKLQSINNDIVTAASGTVMAVKWEDTNTAYFTIGEKVVKVHRVRISQEVKDLGKY